MLLLHVLRNLTGTQNMRKSSKNER